MDKKQGEKMDKNKKVTAKQMQVAQMLANPDETLTKREISEACNISRATLYNWLADENFNKYLDSIIYKYTDAEVAEVWKSLCRKAKNGDVNAIKLFFEMKGKYKNQVELSGNITFIDDVNE